MNNISRNFTMNSQTQERMKQIDELWAIIWQSGVTKDEIDEEGFLSAYDAENLDESEWLEAIQYYKSYTPFSYRRL